MGISIITPHYNDFKGIQKTYECLKKQNSNDWEWIVVDDFSDLETKQLLKDYSSTLNVSKVKVIFNDTKTNASVCRNIGIDNTTFPNLVFLDSDDFISEDFVANRLVQFEEFVVFKNYDIVNEKSELFPSKPLISNPLDCFLSANFIWQTTCILWKKSFLIEIGKFDPNLQRLQDVELSIRALFVGKNYTIIDNKVDFYYCTKPIRLKAYIVRQSCASVNYLISKIHANYILNAYRQTLIKGYYYACVKSLYRTNIRKDIVYVQESLKQFYKKNYINLFIFIIGITLLILYKYHMISGSLFIRINRYFFK